MLFVFRKIILRDIIDRLIRTREASHTSRCSKIILVAIKENSSLGARQNNQKRKRPFFRLLCLTQSKSNIPTYWLQRNYRSGVTVFRSFHKRGLGRGSRKRSSRRRQRSQPVEARTTNRIRKTSGTRGIAAVACRKRERTTRRRAQSKIRGVVRWSTSTKKCFFVFRL